jgi:uncharacterized protein YkwD
MSTTPGGRRWTRRFLVVLLLLVLAPEPAGASAGPVSSEKAFVTRINALRAGRQLPALRVDAGLRRKARRWAGQMAAKRRIWHSTLSDGVTADWQKLGENVGRGPSVGPLHNAFVNSPLHYANLVDPAFRYIGVGVVTVGGTSFVSEVFMQRRLRRFPPARTER